MSSALASTGYTGASWNWLYPKLGQVLASTHRASPPAAKTLPCNLSTCIKGLLKAARKEQSSVDEEKASKY